MTLYARKMYQDQRKGVNTRDIVSFNKPNDLDVIYCKSSESMTELPDNSVHIMITSPPYNVGMEYDNDSTLSEYLTLLRNVFSETMRVLIDGGRACINIGNVGRKPYIPLSHYVTANMLEIGFLMRGEIIWNKGASAGKSTAWGSWKSAANPVLRDQHEYILVFSKGRFNREKGESTITKERFIEYTKTIWTFNAVSSKRNHPAPFPLELPIRLIDLYSYAGDIVLDPFMGSGTTADAAIRTNRRYIGYEIHEKYVDITNKRINESVTQRNLLKGEA